MFMCRFILGLRDMSSMPLQVSGASSPSMRLIFPTLSPQPSSTSSIQLGRDVTITIECVDPQGPEYHQAQTPLSLPRTYKMIA